jgi:hypothetical protein
VLGCCAKLRHQERGERWNFFSLADLQDGIQDASISYSRVMQPRSKALRAGLLSLLGAVLVTFGCVVGCTINPQPLPPTDPDPTPTVPGGGGGENGGGGDFGSATSASADGGDGEGGSREGGGADGGDAAKGDAS